MDITGEHSNILETLKKIAEGNASSLAKVKAYKFQNHGG